MKPPLQSLLTAQEIRLVASILLIIVLGWAVKSCRNQPQVVPLPAAESARAGE